MEFQNVHNGSRELEARYNLEVRVAKEGQSTGLELTLSPLN